ncbi:MAG: cytochrome-c peroxidase [Woeseia sp.]
MKSLPFLLTVILVSWPDARAGQDEQEITSVEKLMSSGYLLHLPFGLRTDNFRIPEDNPLTRDKIELGRLLFFDSRLSADDSVACASCHVPEKAFADNVRLATGINGARSTRNAPAVINRIGASEQFHDGRAASLEEQALVPLVSPLEMGMPDCDAVVEKLQGIAGYRVLFENVFGRAVNIDDLARAIASFERTIISGNSRWDQFLDGDTDVLTEAEMRGLIVFQGKGRCSQCHSGWNLTDEKYHNIGIGWDLPESDEGRFAVTKDEIDTGAFKTPTLRDVALTGPYMHDGWFDTLEQVVGYYSSGVIANPYLDVELRRSNLTLEETLELYDQENRSLRRKAFLVQNPDFTRQEVTDLVAFMKALTGQEWPKVRPTGRFPK